MKQIVSKLAVHGKRCVHSSIFLPIIAISIFSFVDLPLFSWAQEIEMSTPIVRTYKLSPAESTATAMPAPSVMPAEPFVIAPPIEGSGVTTTEIKTIESTVTMPLPSIAPMPTTDGIKQPTQPKPLPATTGFEPSPTMTNPAPSGEGGGMAQPMMETKQPANGDQPQKEQKEKQTFFNEDEGTEMEFVDPREVKNALNDIKRMQGDLKRFLKQVKKLPNSADDVATINDLLTQLTGHQKNIKTPSEDMSLREALQDFWDARIWEEVDKIRAKVQLPKELVNVAKDLKKAKKLITQKAFTSLGLDMSAVSAALAESEAAYNEAKTNYDQGNMEDAQLAMEPIHSGLHPGEIMGVLYQMKEIKNRLKGLRNKEVKAIVDELLVDVIDSANDGDFREANQAMNDIRAELMKIMQKYMKATSKLDDKTRAKFDKLEEMIANKLGDKQEKMEPEEEVKE